MYKVVLFFDEPDGMERVCLAQLKVVCRRRFVFFGALTCHLVLDINSLGPAPMSREDAELVAKLAWLSCRYYKLNRVEVQEA